MRYILIIIMFFSFFEAKSQYWYELDTLFSNRGKMLKIIDIACIDDTTCIALTSPSQINMCIVKRTTDGGKTWYNVFADTLSPIKVYYGISYFSRNLCYLNGSPGRTVKSIDGGITWEVFDGDPDVRYSIEMSNDIWGLRVSYYKEDYENFILEYTSDGGNTWLKIDIPEEYMQFYYGGGIVFDQDLFIIRFYNKEFTEQYFVRVEDNLTTWTAYEAPYRMWRYQILDETNAWCTGRNDDEYQKQRIFYSGDGCRTWITLRDEVDNRQQVGSITFHDRLNGFAYGDNYTLLQTKDGGKTWFRPEVEGYPSDMQGKLVHPGIRVMSYPSLKRAYGVTGFPRQMIFKFVNDEVSVDDEILRNINAITYPNPFSESTTISYELDRSGYVIVKIFDALGFEVSELVNDYQDIGSHSCQLSRSGLQAGVYYYSIQIENNTHTGKMILIK